MDLKRGKCVEFTVHTKLICEYRIMYSVCMFRFRLRLSRLHLWFAFIVFIVLIPHSVHTYGYTLPINHKINNDWKKYNFRTVHDCTNVKTESCSRTSLLNIQLYYVVKRRLLDVNICFILYYIDWRYYANIKGSNIINLFLFSYFSSKTWNIFFKCMSRSWISYDFKFILLR